MKKQGSGLARTRSTEDQGGSLRQPLKGYEGGVGVTPPPARSSTRKSMLDLARAEAQALFIVAPPAQSDKDHEPTPARSAKKWSILSKALVGLAIYFVVGIFSVYFITKDLFGNKTNSFVDAFYFCAVTLTTVGYGDLVPSSIQGKLFTCTYFLVGFLVVSSLISGAADYLVSKQEAILVHAIRRKDLDNVDFEAKEYTHTEAALLKINVSGFAFLVISIIGVVVLMVIEDFDLVDAIYCVMVTATTLGYGDEHFTTAAGRFFAGIWVIMSTVCLAQLLLYIAEYRTVLRQLNLAHWVLHRKTTTSDLEAADMEGDGYVSKAEFVIYKLKELQKIDEADVTEILKEFRTIDRDNTGKIRVGDGRAGTSVK